MGTIYLRNLLTFGTKISVVGFDTDQSSLDNARTNPDFQTFFFTNRQDIFFSKIFCGDILIIASPPSTHFFYLQKALDLQLNVLCEKTLGDTPKRIFYLNEFRSRGLILKVSFLERYFSTWVNFVKESDLPGYIHSKRTSIYRGQDVSIVGMTQDLMIHDLDHVFQLLRGESVKNVELVVNNNLWENQKSLCVKLNLTLSSKKVVRWLWQGSYQKEKKRTFFWKDVRGVSRDISFITSENLLQKQLLDFFETYDKKTLLNTQCRRNIILYETFEEITKKLISF